MVSERETLSKTGIIKGKEKGPLGDAFPGKLLLSTSPSPLAPPSDKHFEVLVRTLTKNVMVINTIIQYNERTTPLTTCFLFHLTNF